MTTLDEARVEMLSKRFLGIARAHYQQGPIGRERVLELLNALAIVIAFILAGAEDSEAQEFFNLALERQIDSALEEKARGVWTAGGMQ